VGQEVGERRGSGGVTPNTEDEGVLVGLARESQGGTTITSYS
jgi:hypothetical protein